MSPRKAKGLPIIRPEKVSFQNLKCDSENHDVKGKTLNLITHVQLEKASNHDLSFPAPLRSSPARQVQAPLKITKHKEKRFSKKAQYPVQEDYGTDPEFREM
jgi:hypothetical protein